MTKAMFDFKPLYYPVIVRAVALLALFGSFGSLFSGSAPLELKLLIGVSTAIFYIGCAVLASRFYVPVLLIFSLVQIANLAYNCSNLYVFNRLPLYLITLIYIVMVGLLLGGLGATIITGWSLAGFAIGQTATLNGWLPPPPGYVAPDQSFVIATLILTPTLFLVIYALIVFIAYQIRRTLAQVQQQRDELQVVNERMAGVQATEARLSQQLEQLTQEVAASSQQQSTAAGLQAQQSHNLTATLGELEQNITVIEQATRQADQAVRQASRTASEGQTATTQALQALASGSSFVEAVIQRVVTLGKQASQARAILELIRKVAEETQLLALNANIESVGAGAYGRRFLVIARQVNTLAEQSNEAVEQATGLVRDIEQAVRDAIQFSQLGRTQGEQVGVLSRQASIAYEGVIDSVTNTAGLVRNIVAASSQQTIATSTALQSVQQLSHTAAQAATASQDMAKIIYRLNEVASQLAGSEPTASNVR